MTFIRNRGGGRQQATAEWKEGVPVLNTQERIERLLDQLENSTLSEAEITKIKKKIELLQSLQDH